MTTELTPLNIAYQKLSDAICERGDYGFLPSDIMLLLREWKRELQAATKAESEAKLAGGLISVDDLTEAAKTIRFYAYRDDTAHALAGRLEVAAAARTPSPEPTYDR